MYNSRCLSAKTFLCAYFLPEMAFDSSPFNWALVTRLVVKIENSCCWLSEKPSKASIDIKFPCQGHYREDGTRCRQPLMLWTIDYFMKWSEAPNQRPPQPGGRDSHRGAGGVMISRSVPETLVAQWPKPSRHFVSVQMTAIDPGVRQSYYPRCWYVGIWHNFFNQSWQHTARLRDQRSVQLRRRRTDSPVDLGSVWDRVTYGNVASPLKEKGFDRTSKQGPGQWEDEQEQHETQWLALLWTLQIIMQPKRFLEKFSEIQIISHGIPCNLSLHTFVPQLSPIISTMEAIRAHLLCL